MKMVSIIIVNYNGKEQTKDCLLSLFAHVPEVDHEIILVDNCSSDGSVEDIQKAFPAVRIIRMERNEGFGKANNAGVRASIGEYLYFLNNDTLLKNDIVAPLRNYLENNKNIGAVAPMLLNSDGTFQHSYGYFPSLLNEWRTQRASVRKMNLSEDGFPRTVDWVSFAAVMIRRSAFEKVNGFDERYFMYFEDADVCLRLKKAGWDTMYHPASALVHLGGASWSPAMTSKIRFEYRRSQLLFYALYRSTGERFLLRLYLACKYLFAALLTNGEERQKAFMIIRLAITYAHRS